MRKYFLPIFLVFAILAGQQNLAKADENGFPEIVVRTSDNEVSNIDKKASIKIINKGYFYNQWVLDNYKINICNTSLGCSDNSFKIIPEKNSIVMNEVKILRDGLNGYTLYFYKTGNFNINISARYYNSLINPSNNGSWDNCSNPNCYITSASLNLSVKSETLKLSSEIQNYPENEIFKIDSQLTCPKSISSTQKSFDCNFFVNYSIVDKFWQKYGITQDAEAVLKGTKTVEFCVIKYPQNPYSFDADCSSKLPNLLNVLKQEIKVGEDNKIKFNNYISQGSNCILSSWRDMNCFQKNVPIKTYSLTSIATSFKKGLRANCSSLPPMFNSFKFLKKSTTFNNYGEPLTIYGFQLLRVTAYDGGKIWRFGPYSASDTTILDLWNCDYPFSSNK